MTTTAALHLQCFLRKNYRRSTTKRAYVESVVRVLVEHGAIFLWPEYTPTSTHVKATLLANTVLKNDNLVFSLVEPDCDSVDLIHKALTRVEDDNSSFLDLPLYHELTARVRKQVHNVDLDCPENAKKCFVRRNSSEGFGEVPCNSWLYQNAESENRYTRRYQPIETHDELSEGDNKVVMCPSGFCFNREYMEEWFDNDPEGEHVDPLSEEVVSRQWEREWGFV